MFSKSIFNSNPPKTFNFTSPLIPKDSNPNKDFEVVYPPDDTVSSMEFSPSSLAQNYLIAGSWDSKVRCWEIEQSGKTIPKCIQVCGAPVLDVSWSDDGQRVFTASCDGHGNIWDLASNKMIQVAAHDAPVKTCHWIKAPNYACLMTGSWDKTLKFWDTRMSTPILKIDLPGKCYYADVFYPMAVVGTSSNSIIIYRLDGKPQEYRRAEAPLKHQVRCVSIFRDKKKKDPVGYATGSIEGRVAIQYVEATNVKENFTFKCHRRISGSNPDVQDIYPVNDLKFHPEHGTLATVGADGTFTFWDKDARTKLKPGENMHVPLNKCAFNHNGQIFAYDIGYDWSRGHEGNNPEIKSKIFLRPCYDDCKPRSI